MQPGQVVGPFTIEKELGSGAMGTVHRALYKDGKTRVAIKVMAPGIGTNETAQKRFERESAILKQLKHPNIVRLLASGQYKKSHFYAMEYIEGESLDHVMARRGRLSWEEVVDIGRQLCAALQHAHEQGVIHRDLKPSNLMLLKDGTVKLTDFGIAKDLYSDGLTATNCTVGTASYMSPEQCKGKDISPRSDLYSMGIMFYELVTGRKPFEAESTMDMFMHHVNTIPERPSRYALDLPVWMDTLIYQLLEKDPENRPLNAETVARTLAEIKDKVDAQASAGLERAGKRKTDRKKGEQLDEDDKEAARALLRKKKKKKAAPAGTPGWLQALGILAVLGGLAAVVYFVFLKPPSLESLHQQAAALMKSGDFHDAGAALAGPLAQFDQYYADSNHALAGEMRRWKDEAVAQRAEAQMYNRREKFKAEGPEEELARQGLDEEELGKLDEARATWGKLAKAKGDADANRHAWGLVGEKHLVLLDNLQKKLTDLRDTARFDALGDFKANSPEEEQAFNALKAEFGKKQALPQAREAWEELKRSTAGDNQKRLWHVMAVAKTRELREKTDAAQAGPK